MKQGRIYLAVVVCLMFASLALAGRVAMTDASSGLNGWEGSGGAFMVNQVSGDNGLMGAISGGDALSGSGTSFATFCVERNEHISLGGTQYWTQIDTGANKGGYSGQTSTDFDPISSATALLYSSFRAGLSIASLPVITGTTGDAQRKLTSGLQYAIWRLEGEVNSAYDNPDGSGSGLSKDATVLSHADAMYSWALANANGSLYGVRVLQMWTSYNSTTGVYSGNSQDQLTIVPTPTASMAGFSLLGGIALIGVLRKRNVSL